MRGRAVSPTVPSIPAHVLLTNDGRIMLTDCVFGAALEVLQRNREVLWKEFGLAMPAAANLARFDQQADVTQMGALILAVLLQRPLRAHEYPRGVSDLVVTATESSTAPGSPGSTSALRMWLQEALQIHPRLAFRSAVEAQRSFADIGSAAGSRRGGAMALQVLLRTTCGEPLNQPPVVVNTPMRPAPQSAVAITGAGRATEPLRLDPALGFPEALTFRIRSKLRGELHDTAVGLARLASEQRIADKRGSAERVATCCRPRCSSVDSSR